MFYKGREWCGAWLQIECEMWHWLINIMNFLPAFGIKKAVETYNDNNRKTRMAQVGRNGWILQI